jgi:hypothetical protein
MAISEETCIGDDSEYGVEYDDSLLLSAFTEPEPEFEDNNRQMIINTFPDFITSFWQRIIFIISSNPNPQLSL